VVTTDEVPVEQVDDDADTLTQGVDPRILQAVRAGTRSDWPPEPPLPAELEHPLAEGTIPPPRAARVYSAVRRPTTSSDAR
jgi:hypothetical protein